MKFRPTIFHLVIAILGLAIGYKLHSKPAMPVAAVESRAITPRLEEPAAADVPPPVDFTWKQIESTNYFVYIRNLRRIGCPEETICDIIRSEVDKMFSERWSQTYKPFSEKRYWVAVPLPHLLKHREKVEIAKFDAEKAELMNQLLGTSAGLCGCAEESSPVDRVSRLSEEKQKRASQILKDFEALERELDSETEFSTNKTEVAKARLNLIAQKRAALASVLDAEEIKRLELTVSPRGRYLQNFLFGLQPTEDDFRTVYESWSAFQMLTLSNDAGYLAIPLADARKNLADEFRNRLGDERFDQLRQQGNPEYQNLTQIGELLHWDPAQLSKALTFITEYSKTEQEAMKQPGIDLQKMRAQRDEKLRELLGETRFAEYIKRKPRGGGTAPQFQYW